MAAIEGQNRAMQVDAGSVIASRIAQALPGLGESAAAVPLQDHLQLAQQAMQLGRAQSAIALLEALDRHYPDEAAPGQLLAFALRLEQDYAKADAQFTRALAVSPHAPALLFGQAQTRYELGLPAAALFARAQAAMPGNPPGNPDVLRNRAAAMASEGDAAGAQALLCAALAAQPGWLDGHKVLASLRWTSGDTAHFADCYAAACAAEPGNAALWTAWFSAVAQTRNWAQSLAILDRAQAALGTTPGIIASRLFVACESGDDAGAERLFVAAEHIMGDATNLCRIRFALRKRRLDRALAVALPLVEGPSAGLFWPYLSLIWRLMGDDRSAWLDRPDTVIQHRRIGLSGSELAELGDVLRALHTMNRPYAEQTVRGGTQTDRSVLLRHEPAIRRARDAWMVALRESIVALPPFEAGHPLLGTARSHLVLNGSWSVRLGGGGYNVPHTHPMGWISSSLYVAIPGEEKRGPAPAGHISFGVPPRELDLGLPAYRTIAPAPGMIATFPSTMWHAVESFAQGERLMIALDIRPPAW